ncbi:MAG: LytTR family transcriptional regulator DNA-binding domain-containing protein [Bacteroidales bacterium]|nr:LytTR family transcriptional regulator DNA-binding domain-containing protein [Bacteroidales bacterium]
MIKRFFEKRYPQNYIIRKPIPGALILFLFSSVFTLLYHPLNVHRSFYFGFEATILLYTVPCSIVAGISIYLLRRIPFFRNTGKWNVFREILIIYLVLQLMGVTIFLLGFALEGPAEWNRWNLDTFINSSIGAFLIYMLPFAFFSLINARFLFLNFQSAVNTIQEEGKQELMVHIHSSLKKESLDFKADELVYAMADGNYVMFHLYRENGMVKIPIRNSIADIEQQLNKIPMYYRSHRGFIINLFKVKEKRGNASGYFLKMHHTNEKVPVSRSRIAEFDCLLQKYHS